MVTYEISDVMTVFNSCSKLFKEHWEESAHDKKLCILNIDLQAFLDLEENGNLFVMTAIKDDEIIGYSANIMHNHMLYRDLKVCTNNIIFVKKEYRRGMVGLKLIKETEQKARKLGAQCFSISAKPDTTLCKLLPKLKYNINEISFTKGL